MYFDVELSGSDLHPMAYEVPQHKYSSELLLKLLLNPSIDRSRVCSTWPVPDIMTSSTFIVDISTLKHPDDVRKDFFGRWMYSGSHTFPFKAFFEDDGSVFVEKCAPGAQGNVFYLRKLHCYHPSNTDFRRMLVFVSGKCLGCGFKRGVSTLAWRFHAVLIPPPQMLLFSSSRHDHCS